MRLCSGDNIYISLLFYGLMGCVTAARQGKYVWNHPKFTWLSSADQRTATHAFWSPWQPVQIQHSHVYTVQDSADVDKWKDQQLNRKSWFSRLNFLNFVDIQHSVYYMLLITYSAYISSNFRLSQLLAIKITHIINLKQIIMNGTFIIICCRYNSGGDH